MISFDKTFTKNKVFSFRGIMFRASLRFFKFYLRVLSSMSDTAVNSIFKFYVSVLFYTASAVQRCIILVQNKAFKPSFGFPLWMPEIEEETSLLRLNILLFQLYYMISLGTVPLVFTTWNCYGFVLICSSMNILSLTFAHWQ